MLAESMIPEAFEEGGSKIGLAAMAGFAIAFVIGQAASKLVTAFVDDIITPFVGLFLPTGDLKAMSFTIGKSKFMWGDLISNIIDFLIISFIVFLAYRQLSKFKLVEDKTKPESKK